MTFILVVSFVEYALFSILFHYLNNPTLHVFEDKLLILTGLFVRRPYLPCVQGKVVARGTGPGNMVQCQDMSSHLNIRFLPMFYNDRPLF